MSSDTEELVKAARGVIESNEVKSAVKDALANTSVSFAWGAWLFGHIAEINQLLQMAAFAAAIIASAAAAWYHIRKAMRIGKEE